MTRCTHCKEKWKAKDVWSLYFQNDGKDCPYCYEKQYLSSETFRFSSEVLGLSFLFIFPFFVELSDKNPILAFRKK
ncbi:hypothetical protein AALF16_07295 [Bacillus cereus]|uniref:hypothetical protein n=1 Tax=Bacillus cereus TaxID=1396 RepID=UPI00356C5804